MADGDDQDLPPKRVYIYGRSPPPLDPEDQVGGPPRQSPSDIADINAEWEAQQTPGSFGQLYARRGGDPGLVSQGRGLYESEKRAKEIEPLRGGYFDPRPELMDRIIDERGVTLPELNLKAQFIKARGLREPAFGANLDEPTGTALMGPELARYLNAQNYRQPITEWGEKKDVNLETKLSPQEHKEYQRWAAGVHKNPADEEQDYDLKGYWKDIVKGNPDLPEHMKDFVQYHRDQLRHLGPNAHLPDMYKKPNHPTFSDESMYHGTRGLQGLEPEQGGHWDEGTKTFTPGPANQAHWNRSALQHYFDKYEPEYKVNFPDWYK